MDLSYGWEDRWVNRHTRINYKGSQWEVYANAEYTTEEIGEIVRRGRLVERGTRSGFLFHGSAFSRVNFILLRWGNREVLLLQQAPSPKRMRA